MFGSFLVPSSTVVADESQERTKTSLTNLLESPKETTWCQDDKNTTEPGAALDIFGWTWFTRWRSKVQMYGSALLLLCLCIVRPYLCTTEDWNIGVDPETKTRQPSLLKLQSRTRTVPWKSNTSTTKKNTYMWDVKLEQKNLLFSLMSCQMRFTHIFASWGNPQVDKGDIFGGLKVG